MSASNGPLKVNFDSATALSLDVFDTCLLRRVGDRESVFVVMEQELASVNDLRWLSEGDTGFATLRAKAEERVCANLRKLPNYEVSLDDIYAEFASIAGISEADASRLKAMELDIERKLTIANPEVLSLAREAAKQGLQVVFLSDTYFTDTFVFELLRSCEYDVTPNHVFVSSEIHKSKRTGQLYPFVANSLGVPLMEFVHIGSSLFADVEMAQMNGIQAYHYETLGVRQESGDKKGREEITPEPWTSRSLAVSVRNAIMYLDCLQTVIDTEEKDFWFRLGFERAGILSLGFTLWLIDQCQRDKVQMLIFLGREGQFIKKCFDLVAAWKRVTIDSVYMHASRRALEFPALLSMEDKDVAFLTEGMYGRPVRTYLDRWGLHTDDYRRELLAGGFESGSDIVSCHEDRLRLGQVFKKIHKKVLLAAANESKLVSRYLDQVGVPHKGNIGVVNTGWLGSMQAAFDTLLKLTGRSCSLKGFYLGTHLAAHNTAYSRQAMAGYLTNFGAPEDIDRWVNACVELVEVPFRGSSSSCIGFEEREAGIWPKFADQTGDKKTFERGARIQEGIMQFLTAARPLVEKCMYLDLDPRGAFLSYAEIMLEPTREEATLLGDLTTSDEFENAERIYLASPLSDVGAVSWKIGYAKRCE